MASSPLPTSACCVSLGGVTLYRAFGRASSSDLDGRPRADGARLVRFRLLLASLCRLFPPQSLEVELRAVAACSRSTARCTVCQASKVSLERQGCSPESLLPAAGAGFSLRVVGHLGLVWFSRRGLRHAGLVENGLLPYAFAACSPGESEVSLSMRALSSGDGRTPVLGGHSLLGIPPVCICQRG